ncbi:MAG: nuoM 2 [Gemmataceae bacterium]|nr:nuoM 2 [Gemmataceae bacterium]
MYPTFRILLLLVVLLPLAAAVVLPLCGRAARRVALLVSLLHLGVTAAVVLGALQALALRGEHVLPGRDVTSYQLFQPEFVPGDPGVGGAGDGATGRTRWTLLSLTDAPVDKPGPHVQFFIGVDGLNVWLVALCSVMMVPAILASWVAATDRPGGFYGWMFLLQGGAVGAFLSFDVILFYVFFELTLIPAFFLIGGWGAGSGRRDAARKFFLYTLAGSLLTLVGVIGVVLTNPDPRSGAITFSLPDLMMNVQRGLDLAFGEFLSGNPGPLAAKQDLQFWLFVCLMAGFMVKVPVWPFHTWLPAAYNEAPVGVTVLLSALLAKLGTFGILRFVLPLTPDAAVAYGLPAVGTLAAFGIVYGAFCAYGQRDVKLMIAYSSLSHLGFLVLGLFAFNTEGLSGAVLHMVNHGVSTGAMFALLAFLLDRYRTTDMRQFGGLMGRYPGFAFLAFVLALASIGLPGLNNFVSEMLMLAGLYDARIPGMHRPGLAVVAAVGILLSAWYMLTMLQRVFFNPLREPPATGPQTPTDLTRHELLAFGGLAALCLLLGLFPQTLIGPMKADVAALDAIGDLARDRVAGRRPDLGPPPSLNTTGPTGPAPKGKGGGEPKGKGGGPKGGGGMPPPASPKGE